MSENSAEGATELERTLADIATRLRLGKFPNEQSISQGIVLRVLKELGWNSWDTTLVWPEYQTGEGRADFALCDPPGKPAVFIEVKQPGKAEDAVRQALEYAFHTGVPFIILTDGKSWSFYLPAEQGSYEDRRVYKLDLFERSSPEAAAVLTRYLEYTRVKSGAALNGAREEYRSRNRRAISLSAIPEAWRELVEKGDEFLVEILTDAAESKSGIRPDDDAVANFLAQLGGPAITPTQASYADHRTPSRNGRTAVPTVVPDSTASARRGTLTLKGKTIAYNSAKDAMVIVLRELAGSDPTFLERCAQHPECQGRKRRYIARTPEELYPDRPDLRDFRESLVGGWLVATNLNNILKRNIIKVAAEVAGLTFGSDIKVEF